MATSLSDGTPAVDESLPLLDDVHPALERQDSINSKGSPIPKLQLAIVCGLRVVEPIAFSQVFPYINELIWDYGVTKDAHTIGNYSGLVESAFSVAALCSIYQWAKLSDKIGRRPVVCISVLGVAMASLLFGLSRTFATLLLTRFVGGIFAGSLSVIHSIVGEITDVRNQGLVYPIYGFMFPVGNIVGPLLGGMLSKPAEKFPLFDTTFFRTFPYFLPCLIAAMLSLLAFALGYFYLEETLPGKRRKEEKVAPTSYGATAVVKVVPGHVPTMRELLSVPILYAICLSGGALSFLVTCFEVILVLFLFSSVQDGGLGFGPELIGYTLAFSGTISIVTQFTLFAHLLRRFGAADMYYFCMSLWPYVWLSMPFLNLIARYGPVGEATGSLTIEARALIWAGLAIVLFLTKLCIMAYSLSMILIKENSNPTTFGATNGLSLFWMTATRSVAPALVSTLFTTSTKYNLLEGHLWAIVMALISALACRVALKIKTHSTNH